MQKIILDTSVIIKWFKIIKESKVEKAKEYLKQHLTKQIEINILPLLYFELFNVLLLDKKFSLEDFKELSKKLKKINLKENNLNQKISLLSAKLVKEHSLSFYDASYIALAKFLNTDFITADKKLTAKVDFKFVHLL